MNHTEKTEIVLSSDRSYAGHSHTNSSSVSVCELHMNRLHLAEQKMLLNKFLYLFLKGSLLSESGDRNDTFTPLRFSKPAKTQEPKVNVLKTLKTIKSSTVRFVYSTSLAIDVHCFDIIVHYQVLVSVVLLDVAQVLCEFERKMDHSVSSLLL